MAEMTKIEFKSAKKRSIDQKKKKMRKISAPKLPSPKYTDILEASNMPGVSRITDEGSTKTRRIIWILIVSLFFCIFLVHFIFITVRFAAVPVNQDIIYQGVPFIFPDVTICHTGPFSYNRSRKIKNVTLGENTFDDSFSVALGIKNVWKSLLPRYSNLPLNSYTREDNYEARRTLYGYGSGEKYGHFIQESILDCMFRPEHCYVYQNFTTRYLPGALNCFTFQPEDRIMKRSGVLEGLSLVIMDKDRLKVMTDTETIDFIRGVEVIVHNKGTYPDRSDAVLSQVGFYSEISLWMNHRVAMNLKRKPCLENPPRRTFCHIDHLDNKPHCDEFTYSTRACSWNKAQHKIFHECGCASEEFPLSKHLIPKKANISIYCHYLDPKLIYGGNNMPDDGNRTKKLLEITTKDHLKSISDKYKCHESVLRSLNMYELEASCRDNCVTDTYSQTVATYSWPSSGIYAYKPLSEYGEELVKASKERGLDYSLAEKVLLNNEKNLKKTSYTQRFFTKVRVFPKTTTGILLEEEEAFPISQYLSEFGGILGLWIGFSVMTLVEVIEGFLLLCTKQKDKVGALAPPEKSVVITTEK